MLLKWKDSSTKLRDWANNLLSNTIIDAENDMKNI